MIYRAVETTDGQYAIQYRFAFFWWHWSGFGNIRSEEEAVRIAKKYTEPPRARVKRVIWR